MTGVTERGPGAGAARWKAASAVLALAVLATAAWGYAERRGRAALEVRLENERRRAFVELLTHVEDVGALLNKSLVSASPRQNVALFAEIRRHAEAAQANLAQLPLTGLPTERAGRFLSQVGDFAASLGRQNTRGAPVSDGQWETLGRLRAQTRQLSVQLRELQRRMQRDGLRFTPSRPAVATLLRHAESQPPALLRDGLGRIDREIQQFPTLIYDGPFSDHLLRPEPLGLRPGSIGPDDARRIALEFVPVPPGTAYEAAVSGEKNGPIPVYAVSVAPAGSAAGPRFLVDVTRQGGHVAWMLNPRQPGRDGVTLDEARSKAAAFLRSRGYAEMEVTHAASEDGTAVVVFAAVQDGVRLYPDLVKVRVARDTGEITGLEATGFLMSHRPRNLPRPALTVEQARARLQARLAVDSQRLALIPLDTRAEVLTYEFAVRLGQDRFLIYVNALTGDEEKILQLIDGPNGTLTM